MARGRKARGASRCGRRGPPRRGPLWEEALGARVGKGEGTPKAPQELSRSSWCRLRQCPILDSSARTGNSY